MTAETKSVAVLAYHKIGAPPGTWTTWNYVPEAVFDDNLRRLRDRGWVVLDLDAFLEGLIRPESLPPRSALLTFDDGYRSMLRVAEPALARFDCPSVVFVPTEYVGATNGFDRGNEPEEPMCDWDELRELGARGVAVEAHGVSHRTFSALDPEQQAGELVRSRTLLGERLDRPVRTFAFPYGDAGSDPQATRELVRSAGYAAAFHYKGGPLTVPGADPFALTRIPIGADTDLDARLAAAEASSR